MKILSKCRSWKRTSLYIGIGNFVFDEISRDYHECMKLWNNFWHGTPRSSSNERTNMNLESLRDNLTITLSSYPVGTWLLIVCVLMLSVIHCVMFPREFTTNFPNSSFR